ncbi:hypothetical protein QDX81_03215 [Pseudomonas sp. CW003PS]|nr:hypothetical protein QDX81_03215 [Pseudomonas sp. CW003PS]
MAAILFCRSQPKPMRGLDLKQNELFSYTTLEQRIPNDHPLRPLRGCGFHGHLATHSMSI